jgi:hypothetical protein
MAAFGPRTPCGQRQWPLRRTHSFRASYRECRPILQFGLANLPAFGHRFDVNPSAVGHRFHSGRPVCNLFLCTRDHEFVPGVVGEPGGTLYLPGNSWHVWRSGCGRREARADRGNRVGEFLVAAAADYGLMSRRSRGGSAYHRRMSDRGVIYETAWRMHKEAPILGIGPSHSQRFTVVYHRPVAGLRPLHITTTQRRL